jgi:hypothetical protein
MISPDGSGAGDSAPTGKGEATTARPRLALR